MSEHKIDKLRNKLREPFPPEAISQHPTKTFLSTIKAIYVVERLNDIFGIGGWDLTHEIVFDEPDYVTVRGKLEIKEFNYVSPAQYGGHKKTGTNTEPADGYKSAVTDCLSKCASYLEIGIDVFKGLVDVPKTGTSKTTEKTGKALKELSQKQWDFIKSIGKKGFGLSEAEVVEFVKWVAKKENIAMRHWKIAKLLLPEANFNTEYAFYSKDKINEPEPPPLDGVAGVSSKDIPF